MLIQALCAPLMAEEGCPCCHVVVEWQINVSGKMEYELGSGDRSARRPARGRSIEQSRSGVPAAKNSDLEFENWGGTICDLSSSLTDRTKILRRFDGRIKSLGSNTVPPLSTPRDRPCG